MVHACVVCKKVDHLNPNLSFHRFPQDPEKRKLWFSLVGILDNQPLRKNPELCSDHFFCEDMLVKANGAKYIKKGANPRRCEGLLFLDDQSNSSESTVCGTPPAQKNPLAISKLCFDDVILKSDDAGRDVEEPSEIVNSPNIQKSENIAPNLISVPGPSGYGLASFSSGRWVCRNNKCEKANSGTVASSTSLETCNILCPELPPLWPKPNYIEILNRNSTLFQREHIFLKIHSPLEIQSTLEAAANIFLEGLPGPIGQYSLIDGENRVFKLNIHVKEANTRPSTTINESYTLYSQKLDNELVVNIFANTYFGARHGLETLSQLIWYDSLLGRLRLFHDIQIVDEPSFSHRGVLIDVSRNYFPVYLLKKSIDGMAASKLNVLHLHISDAASFPIELPNNKYLSENGAYDPDMKYSSEEIKDLINYARIRGIRTILEIDAPSHISFEAWPKNQTLCGDRDIFKTTLNPDKPETFNTLQSIYQDLFKLGTDNDTFHIGDDEVVMDCWKNTESVRKEHDLYGVWSKFTNKMMDRLAVANNGSLPKNIVLWSSPLTDRYIEYLDHKDNLVVQYWFGKFKQILDSGYKIIFSTVGQWYLDCGFGPWKKSQQHGSCDPYTDWRKFYKYRPWQDYSNRIKQVLGGEVCLWSEEVSSDDLETRLWPRAAAFAERMWSDPDVFEQDEVFRRIDFHSRRLRERGFRVAAIWPEICSLYPEKC